MVLDLVDGVLPIVLVDAKGLALANPPPHCLLTLLKPFFTSEMVVRDLTTDFVSFCKSFVCKLPAGNDAKHHVPDQLPRLVTEPG